MFDVATGITLDALLDPTLTFYLGLKNANAQILSFQFFCSAAFLCTVEPVLRSTRGIRRK